MPLFFFISGMSSTHFNPQKYSFKDYFQNKFFRLILPLGFAIIFFLIPRLYLSQEFEPWTRIDPDKDVEKDYFLFM